MEIEKKEQWAKYLYESKANQLPKAFEFVRKEAKSKEEYDEILVMAMKMEEDDTENKNKIEGKKKTSPDVKKEED